MKKKLTLFIATCIIFGCVTQLSCKPIEVIQDPNGKPQQVADKAEEVIDAVENVINDVPIPTPWKEAIAGALIIAGGVVSAIQSVKRKAAEVATSEVVMGIENGKKTGDIVMTESLAKTFNSTQSPATKKIVDKLQS